MCEINCICLCIAGFYTKKEKKLVKVLIYYWTLQIIIEKKKFLCDFIKFTNLKRKLKIIRIKLINFFKKLSSFI